jgi:hypothetical protein
MDDSTIKPALNPTAAEDTDLKHIAQVGRDQIELRPHESYEGAHRWDPLAEWTSEEEAKVVRKADFYLLSWICLMFFGLQLDRGNIGNALTDNMLGDLGLNTNDYNNVCHFRMVLTTSMCANTPSRRAPQSSYSVSSQPSSPFSC